MIQARREAGKIFSAYSPYSVQVFRNSGGRWDGENKCWNFSEEKAAEIFEKLFGSGDMVTVRVTGDEISEQYDGFAYIGGYVIAMRKNRDYHVMLADGVEMISGSFANCGGSMKHPSVNVPSGAEFRLQVYRSFAEAYELKIEPEKESEPGHDPLADFTDAQLIEELTRRGYKIEHAG